MADPGGRRGPPLFLDQTEATPGHVDFQLFINIIYLFIYLSFQTDLFFVKILYMDNLIF